MAGSQGQKKERSERGAAGEAASATRSRRARAHASGSGAPFDLPGWLAPALFAVVTVLLFGRFIFSNGMLLSRDTLALGYTARKFFADALQAGDFPLWYPDLLGGMPFLEAFAAGDSMYPTSLLLLFLEPHRALGWKLVLHVFVAGLAMYGWSRSLGRSRAASLVAGLGYLLAPYLVTLVQPGHDGKMFVTALTPLLFWAMESTFRRRGLLPYVGVAFVVALVIVTTHVQMAYFLFGAAGAYYAFRCWEATREGAARDSGEGDPVTASVRESRSAGASSPRPRAALASYALFLAAAVAGACAAGVQIFPALEYQTTLSRRTLSTTAASPEESKAYAALFSLHQEELAAMVVPEFVGASVQGDAAWTDNTYWGRNGFKLNSEYVGLVLLLLAAVSFGGAPRRALRWFMTGLGGLALLYALGAHTPVWHVAYAVLPGIKMFRAASMVSFLFTFAVVTLAAFGVDRLLGLAAGGSDEEKKRVTRVLWILAGLVGAGFLLAASGVLQSLWTAVVYRDIGPRAQILEGAKPFITRGFLFATMLAAATAGAAWAALRGVLPRVGLTGALLLLVAIDLWRVDAAFVQVIDPAQAMQSVMQSPAPQPDAIVTELLSRKASEPPFRVARLGDDQGVGLATYGVQLAGGHHPFDLARYRELLDMPLSEQARNLFNPNMLRLLGVEYVIWPTSQVGAEPGQLTGEAGEQMVQALLQGGIDIRPLLGAEVVTRSTVGGQNFESLLRIPTLPRARLVGDVEVLPDGQHVARILQPDFDPARTAVLAEAPPTPLPGGDPVGAVTWEEEGNDHLRMQVTSDRDALLIVADNWHPGWHATVDGVEVPVLRAYHTLRAIPVGAGSHAVEMYYHPAILHWSAYGSLATILLLTVVAAVSWWRGRARDRVAGAA